MKKQKTVRMPSPGQECGMQAQIPVYSVFKQGIELPAIKYITVPFGCNIEKITIHFGDLKETLRLYDIALKRKKRKGWA